MNISKYIVESIEQQTFNDVVDCDDGCCICATKKAVSFKKRKDVLSQSFSDYNVLKNRESQYICNYCEKLVSGDYMESPKGKRCGLRLYSFLIEEGKFRILSNIEKESFLFDYQFKLPYLLCLSDTGQKHISWKSALGNSNTVVTFNLESGTLYFNRTIYYHVYLLLKKLYNNGISKDELLQCNLKVKNIHAVIDKDVAHFKDIATIKKYKDDACYNFIISCLQRQDKKEV